MEPLYGPEFFKIMQEGVVTRERMLRLLTNGTANASELLGGVQQGLNDLLETMMIALEDTPANANLVLAAYKEQTGRNLFDDAGNPQKVAKAIVKRGAIENDTEFYLLKEVMSNVDQTVFKESQTEKAGAMLDDYEFSKP